MSVFYGVFSLSDHESISSRLSLLSGQLAWPGCEEFRFKHGAFRGGVILHPSFSRELHEFLFVTEHDRYLVLLSGYFYNRPELIKIADVSDPEISNPELAWRLFLKFGNKFANLVNGDFSILIYQSEPQEIMIWRDHLGIRPLVYAFDDGALWVCTNGTALCKVLFADRKISPGFLKSFLGHPDEADLKLLPARAARKLPPGHHLEISGNFKSRITKFWYPEQIREERKLGFETALNDLSALVRDAVAIRSDRRFSAGAHLSGGLDSGIVAALARQQYNDQPGFPGFSWSPLTDPPGLNGFDERSFVRETGQHCAIEPVFSDLHSAQCEKVYTDGRLFGESVHESAVREQARSLGINLLFSGWGGDEFISINDRGIPSDLLFKGYWRHFFRRFPLKRPLRLSKYIVKEILMPAFGIDYYALTDKNRRSHLYMKGPHRRIVLSPLYKWQSRRDVHLALLRFGHLAWRTELWFDHGYPAGIEYRYPLLDKRIVEYMLRIPSVHLYRNGYVRLMLREISRDILPDTVVWSRNKENPAMFSETRSHCMELYYRFLPELEKMKVGDDFSFVNFEALEKDLREPSLLPGDGIIPDCVVFFLSLVRLYAFTRYYYRS